MSSSRKAKDTPTTQPKLGTTDLKQPVTPKQRGATMTLRKTHTVIADKSPTVFPNGKVSTYDRAPSAEKRKILDEADKISQEERAKMQRGGGGSSSNIKLGEVDSPPLAHHGQKRTDSEKKRGKARSKKQVANNEAVFMQAPPSPVPNYIA